MAIFSILFCFLFAKLRSQSIGNGIVYGFVLCLILFTVMIGSNTNGTYNFASAQDNFWTLGTLLNLMLMGVAASLAQRGKS